MPIARRPVVVLDCPDPLALATFYAGLLGGEVRDDGDWAELQLGDWPPLNFQHVDDYRRPSWPGQDAPQQLHLDVVVDDLDAAEEETLALGATKAEHQPGSSFRVFLDPAGHPFCLCVD
ncbi:VOC family protein [Lapillicoccus jejuensis]|uniref:Glyoxalase-like domain-containing protein n=1 Tax=Lapillicoccus jejuensis TaxID=402171 RepID=A0A542DVQ3_9MICO|nr:VOC family protein [Lapillicoccus jejuensis]TQJ07115.1 hypothetical protein FB458_0164 [Lapillicoccus jejuensis]